MAEAAKKRPMDAVPKLEVIAPLSLEEQAPTGVFPGAAIIEGGIEEIVAPKNLVATSLLAAELLKVMREEKDPLDALTFRFEPATQGLMEASEGPQSSDADAAAELEKSLSNKLVAEVSSSAPDVKKLCDTYGLKREELGRMTGFSLRALAEWSAGKLPSQPAKRRLQEIRRLLDALSEIVQTSAIAAWLHQPNRAFDEMTPLQVIEVGEIDRLWAMVHDLRSGQPE